MTDRDPAKPGPADFRETAERSQAAGIADESASYVNAANAEESERQDADGIPQTGEEDPLAEVSTDDSAAGADEFARSEREQAGDGSDSIEPGRIPGSAEDIDVDGETGPGPSG